VPEMNNLFGSLKYNWPGISWALFILIISSITPPAIYIPDLFDLFAPDKIVHFVVYGILCFLLIRGFRKMPAGIFTRNQFFLGLAFSAVYGGLIELYQGLLLTNRTGDWVDFIANCIGAGIGYLTIKIVDRFQTKGNTI
jgi:hypothetical protein